MKTLLLLLSVFVVSTTAFPDVPNLAEQTQPLKVGQKAPNPEVRTLDSKESSLKEVRNGEPTLLIFYRGNWCPYCVRHLSDLQTVKSELSEMGWKLVGISPDKPEILKEGFDKADVDYTLVSDNDLEAAKAFGIAFQVQDDTLETYKGYGIDLIEASGRTHQQLPVPSVFAIDAEGVIQYVYTNPDYRKRLSGKDLIDALK